MKKTNIYGLYLIGMLAVLSGLLYLLNPFEKAAANPSTISQPGVDKLATASASSTPTFMRAGTATSTLTLDTINGYATTTLTPLVSDGITNAIAINEAFLAVQMTGSSSVNSLVRVNWEYSNDGIDFYRDNATSTVLTYSSSTPNGIGGQAFTSLPQHRSTGNITQGFLLAVPSIPSRYVRAVLTVPIGSLNSTNWAQYFTRQQR